MPSIKKKPQKLDLSSDIAYGERTADFTVQQYDYNELQSGILDADAQLESDLNYLLASQEDGKVPKHKLKGIKKLNIEEPKRRIKRRNLFTKLEEIRADMDDIVLSSDEEEPKETGEREKPRSKAAKNKEPIKSKYSEPTHDVKNSPVPDLESDQTKPQPEALSSEQSSSLEAGDRGSPSPEQLGETKPKKKRNRKKKSPSEEPEEQKNREKQGPKKISPAQVSSTILPEKEPVSTIIGLTPQQIVNMKLTDVKFKIISTNPGILKICRNVLSFVTRESEGLFASDSIRDGFVELCVHVAMRESGGFNDVSKKKPDLMARLAPIKELTLEHTRTTITESSRKIHQNDFDYTVFSYIGHIIIWASNLQRNANKPTLIDRLGFTERDVLSSMGGRHLWDRIRRDPKTINMKRWKHIQKFRQNYAFEEHQFVVILRFMHLGTGLC